MEIVLKTGVCEYDDTRKEEMIIDGKKSLYVQSLSECPEDAIIGRDLVSCGDVIRYMKLAHTAGARGESFDVVEEPMDE